MKTYRILWLIVCSVVGTVGAGLALAWSIPVMLAIFGCAAGIGACAVQIRPAFGTDQGRPSSPGETRRMISTWALVCGSAAVAAIGIGELLGGWVAVGILALVAGSSPGAFHLYRQWLRRHAPSPPPPGRRISHQHRSTTLAGNPTDSPPRAASAAMPPVAPRSLNDAELCLAWRASFSALRNASAEADQLSIVEARRAYLDEFERRNRGGLAAWLASGARAAGDPSRFVVGDSDAGRTTIDWDGLIHGPDR